MKRLIIICEGHTEKAFCNSLLEPYFREKGILIQAPLIKKSGGGIVSWKVLKDQINKHLLENAAYVTTFIDYYGIHDSHKFPGWEEAKSIPNKEERIDFLEHKMLMDFSNDVHNRYIPYIQLHEFEGLLICNIDAFDEIIELNEYSSRSSLVKLINDYPNPELINNGKSTAPSKRLMELINGYDKVLMGEMIAEEIGLEEIRRKCPRFNHWIETLENI